MTGRATAKALEEREALWRAIQKKHFRDHGRYLGLTELSKASGGMLSKQTTRHFVLSRGIPYETREMRAARRKASKK